MTAHDQAGGERVAALELRRLTVSYGSRPVLWDVDARFPAGALSAIVGPNGAGKSTLLKAALGLIAPDAGQSWSRVGRSPPSPWPRSRSPSGR